MSEAATIVVGSLVGLTLGSFATTAGVRTASGGTALLGRSACDTCRAPLGFEQTAPLVAYLASRGRCRSCAAGIDPRHPIGELLGGISAAAALWAAPDLRGLVVALLGLLLIYSAVVDSKIERLPDWATAMVAGLALALAIDRGSVSTALTAAAIVGGALWALSMIARGSGGLPALGLGDVKLAAALSLWLGFAAPWMILGASLLGLLAVALLRPANGRVAFGPALAAAGWIVGWMGEARLWPTT
jgi:leader peptidase (prepilin peptidase) / N-methyltransferase